MNIPHDTARVPLQQVLGRLADDLQAQPLPPLQARPMPVRPMVPSQGLKPRAPGAGRAARSGRLAAWPAWRVGPDGADGARAPLAWSGALACVLVLLGAGWLMVQGSQSPGDGAWLAETRPLRETGFWPVADPDRWAGPDAGVETVDDGAQPPQATQAAWVVRTELPAERLALLGLPYDPGRAARPVRAELLLHASGDVLAVRVLP